MAIKTAKKDVVANFHRYIGRMPSTAEDWRNVEYLMTKPPQEVEKRLKASVPKNAPSPPKQRTETDRRNAWESAVKDSRKKETKTSRRDVIANFHRYMGRNPKSDEDWRNVQYLTKFSPDEVERRLRASAPNKEDKLEEREEETVADEPEIETTNTELNKWIDSLIDTGELSSVEGTILENALSDEYIGSEIPSEEELNQILKDAETNAISDIEPYYEKMTQRDLEDLKDVYADIRNESLRYKQQEAKSYAEKLANAKQGLRARGLTFSGKSRATLGKEGALKAKGIEGELPQQRRYDWEDRSAGWQERAREAGKTAERELGSKKLYEERDYLDPRGLADPYGHQPGTRFDIDYDAGKKSTIYKPHKKEHREYVKYGDKPLEKKKEIERSKWERVGLQRTY